MITRILLLAALLVASTSGAQTVNAPGFAYELTYFGAGIVSIDFGPDGRLYATEKRGRLVRFSSADDFETPEVLLDLRTQVNAVLERGLLGLALDPQFTANRYIYLFYSTDTDQRLVRYQLTTDLSAVDGASEVVLLAGLPNVASFHNGGEIAFRPGEPEHVYISLGDDGRTDLAADPTAYEGKLLRVDRLTGLGLAGNPFFDGDADSVVSRVWATGLRNAFRFAFHPTAGATLGLYSSENGDGTDRISWIGEGSDGNWNPSGDGFVGCPAGCFLDPVDPDHRILARVEPSQIGIAIAAGGPFAVGGQPTLYAANWFPNTPFIRRWTLSGDELSTATPADGPGVLFAEDIVFIDMAFGPDGCVYGSQTGGNESADFGTLARICATGGAPPTAAFSTDVDPLEGSVPLTVQFTDESTDTDGTIVDWLWEFGDGETASERNPSHTYADTGDFVARLTVTDNSNQVASVERAVRVFSAGFALDLTVTLTDGRVLPGQPVTGPVELRFFELDGVTPLLPIGAGDNTLIVSNGEFDDTLFFDLVQSGLVVTASEDMSDPFATVRVGLALDPSEGGAARTAAFILSDRALIGTVATVRGEPAQAAIGVSDEAGDPIDLVGGRDSTPGTGAAFRVESDVLGFFHVALPADAPDILTLDLPGDLNPANLAAVTRSTAARPGARTVSFVAGVIDGGRACADLSGIAAQPTRYRDLQEIWSDNCTGCHTPVSPQSAGLSLLPPSQETTTNRASIEAPGLGLLAGGDVGASYLFEKVNCEDPQTGASMPPSGTLSLADQARIRDFILEHISYRGFETP